MSDNMTRGEFEYLQLLSNIFHGGFDKGDRTGTGTRSLCGGMVKFNLDEGFPLITTKKTLYKKAFVELCWLIKGHTNTKYLKDHGVDYWDAWADEDGNLGPVYGSQWRNWNGDNIDQLQEAIMTLQENPNCRRNIVSAWNPSKLSQMRLPPCHHMFQFYTRPIPEAEQTNYWGKGEKCKLGLSIHSYQRSCDMFIGVPFDFILYGGLIHAIGCLLNMKPDQLVWTGTDCHIYSNHMEQTKRLFELPSYAGPKLKLDSICLEYEYINEFKPSDFIIQDYEHGPFIKGDVAV